MAATRPSRICLGLARAETDLVAVTRLVIADYASRPRLAKRLIFDPGPSETVSVTIDPTRKELARRRSSSIQPHHEAPGPNHRQNVALVGASLSSNPNRGQDDHRHSYTDTGNDPAAPGAFAPVQERREALGTQGTFEACLRVLRPGSTLSSLGVYSDDLTIPADAFAAGPGDHKIVTTLCPGGKKRMRLLIATVASGRADLTPLVTQSRLESGSARFSHGQRGSDGRRRRRAGSQATLDAYDAKLSEGGFRDWAGSGR